MKMDIPLFLKIHNLSVRFGEKQKSASEILMILQKKRIPVSVETILDLIGYLDGEEYWEKLEENSNKEENKKKILTYF